MNKNALKNYKRWLNSKVVSDIDKETLKNMGEKEIDDAFFQDIKFGTAGMRGIIGPGTNRMNYFTVRKACVAFGKYLISNYSDAPTRGVAISHDNRHQSREFTLLCADILNDMGINTYIFDSLRPTPELSYTVRYKHCVGGIMITASHNPKEYNGFKVYDEEGCQLTPSKIAPLLEIIAKLPDELNVQATKVTDRGVNEVFGEDVDDTYVKLCEDIQLNPDLDKSGFKIVYTPNHGASYINAIRVFKDCGYEVYPVLSQCTPDPDFSATKSPNPEEPVSYEESIKLAKEVDADLICMTDPDGDRVGLACKNKYGEYVLMTGNESAAVLLDYVLSERKKKGLLSDNGVVYSTVVTSSLGQEIAKDYGVKTELFLTGFKYIGDRIHYHEVNNGPEFEFGYEESYGCLVKPFVRDKDGIQAILLYCEAALFYKKQGLTLEDAYNKLGEKHYHHKAKLFNIYFKGSDGKAKMNKLMDRLKNKAPKKILGSPVVRFENYFDLTYTDKKTKKTGNIFGLPVGDLVKFTLKNKCTIAVRPSGTEPKCKFYIEAVSDDLAKAKELPDLIYQELIKILKLDI